MRRPSGLSLVEVLVASSLFVVIMMIGLGALKVVKRAGDHLKGRSQPRQQLRSLLGHLQREVRAATFIFDPHQTLNFGNGFSHAFDGAPPRDPAAPAAHEVAYAIAESAASEPAYTVQALFLQPDAGSDRAYEGAHRIVMASVGDQHGATPGSPADIALGHLPISKAEVRSFGTASPADGLKVRRNATGDGLFLVFVIGHRTEGEAVVNETYQAQLTMRNNR